MCHETWRGNTTDAVASPFAVEVTTGERMPSLRFDPPEGSADRGPCVVLTDIYGMVPFYHEVARRLAAAGHPTLLLDTFFREGPLAGPSREAAFARRALMDEPLGIADAGSAVDTLRVATGAARVGVVGFCIGGLFALDLAAEREDIVAVSFYGFPEGISVPARVPAPKPVDHVDSMRSPILAFWGDNDHNVPMEQIERFVDATTLADVDCETHVYEGAGHGFLQGLVEDGHDSEAAVTAWARTIDVLASRLGD